MAERRERLYLWLYTKILMSMHVHLGWLWRRGPRAIKQRRAYDD